MAKKVNITEKLELGGNPFLVIGDQDLEVNADAATVLKIMGVFRDSDPEHATIREVMDVYEIIFPEETRKKIEGLHLSFTDLYTVIQEAQNLIMGGGEEEAGEAVTHATT